MLDPCQPEMVNKVIQYFGALVPVFFGIESDQFFKLLDQEKLATIEKFINDNQFKSLMFASQKGGKFMLNIRTI